MIQILQGDVLEQLATLPDESVHCCVTSPPYWGLRSYLPKDHPLKSLEIGSEKTIEEYVAKMVQVFGEVRRVLRSDATCWLNLGDSYASNCKGSGGLSDKQLSNAGSMYTPYKLDHGLKDKDLCMIPARVALALQADGWWLRQDIIWHKPNPMPESVTDRCTKAHEYIFLLSKSERYFFDNEAIKEPVSCPDGVGRERNGRNMNGVTGTHQTSTGGTSMRNKRSVWTIPSAPYSGAHFATFPPKLIEPCIMAGTSERGCCPKCGKPWERDVRRDNPSKEYNIGEDMTGGSAKTGNPQTSIGLHRNNGGVYSSAKTLGWEPVCQCDGVDRRVIDSPTGERAGDDPSLITGRAGMNRPRGDNEGSRGITRYEQAQYAQQLKSSAHWEEMEAEVGTDAFAHYLRTDDSGARPPRPDRLESWIGKGWLTRVELPESSPLKPIPCTVLDPFGGSGTTGKVAIELGRKAILIELNPEYLTLIKKRTNVRPIPVQQNFLSWQQELRT